MHSELCIFFPEMEIKYINMALDVRKCLNDLFKILMDSILRSLLDLYSDLDHFSY